MIDPEHDPSSSVNAYWRRKVQRIRARGELAGSDPAYTEHGHQMIDPDLALRITLRDHPSDFPGGII